MNLLTSLTKMSCQAYSNRFQLSNDLHNYYYYFTQVFQCPSGDALYSIGGGLLDHLPVTAVRFLDRCDKGSQNIVIASCKLCCQDKLG